MTHAEAEEIERLVAALAAGEAGAFDRLLPLVYDELKSIAESIARRRGGTLQPTALVNEVYLRLVRRPDEAWEGKRHFLSVAARAMRQLLADHGRQRGSLKRGGAFEQITLDEDLMSGGGKPVDGALDASVIDEALAELATLDARQARIVELRYFGGLENREIAALLGLAVRTIELDLQMARTFLRRRLA